MGCLRFSHRDGKTRATKSALLLCTTAESKKERNLLLRRSQRRKALSAKLKTHGLASPFGGTRVLA